MRIPSAILFGFLLHGLAESRVRPAKRFYDSHDYYVIQHNPSGPAFTAVADALGVEIIEKAGELDDHWLVRAPKLQDNLAAREEDVSDRVLARYNALNELAQRTTISQRSEQAIQARELVSSIQFLERQTLRQRHKRAPPSFTPATENTVAAVKERFGIRDPMFPEQWHLINEEYPEHMMNVTGVWAMGITGKGVITSFLDDGLDYTSEDLKDNFDAWDSHDFNDHEELPTPKKDNDHHGTRCAGQVAAIRNNVCGVGIAYDSKVAGVRILSGRITDVDEASALNFGYQNVSVYSCSWGPPDNGKSMDAPSILIAKAVLNGINRGRAGKGSIFVFASGNGAHKGDQCNFDGYTNSIYSVTVSAVDYMGLHPYYSEACAANMVVAYSSGGGQHIVTTDRGTNNCATTHGGTSAAAPNAAGIIALALQVRPDLTWRDVQYLCVETALHINPDDPDWENTAAGRPYSYKYGFGAIDGYAYIKKAQQWKLVKPQAWFHSHTIQLGGGVMSAKKEYSGGSPIVPGGVSSYLEITSEMLKENNFGRLEHINIKVWIQHARRGDVEVEIISPSGVRSILASYRERDEATTGYPGWTFMSIKHWGEDPIGRWTIKVADQDNSEVTGAFLGWNMIFWGESVNPRNTRLFELPSRFDLTFPPTQEELSAVPIATTTREYSKPTEFLDPDLGHVPGEKSHSAFAKPTSRPSVTSTTTSSASSSSSSSEPKSSLDDVQKLVSSNKWFFSSIGFFGICGLGAFIYYRRRNPRRGAEYSSLAQDGDYNMSNLAGHGSGRAPTTKALYDALDQMSADPGAGGSRRPGLGFHSAFLDDEPATAGPESGKYKDEPDESDETPQPSSSRGSGEEGWERTP